ATSRTKLLPRPLSPVSTLIRGPKDRSIAGAGPTSRNDNCDSMSLFRLSVGKMPTRQASRYGGFRRLVEAEIIEGPQHMRRQRRRDVDRAAGRVRQGQPARMEMQARPDLGPRDDRGLAAILAVAEDRRADRLAVQAKLMRAAGQRPHREEGGAFA